MPVLPSITRRAPANANLWNVQRDALAGEPGTEIRIWHDHPTERALDLRNDGTGPILRIRNALGETMLEVTQDDVTIAGLIGGGVGPQGPPGPQGPEGPQGPPGGTGGSGSFSGPVTAPSFAATGAISAGGLISGANLQASGSISANNITAVTYFQGSTASFSGQMDSGSIATGNGTFAGFVRANSAVNLKRTPSHSYGADADNGWYRFAENIQDIGTPAPGSGDTEEYVLIGAGNDISNGLVTITKTGAVAFPYPIPKSSLAVYQGAAGFPVTPYGTPGGGIRSQIVVAGAGGGYAAGVFRTVMERNSDVADTQSGFGYGIHVESVGGTDFRNGASASCGILGAKIIARSEAGSPPFQQTITGLQVNVDGLTAQDLLHGVEIDLGNPGSPIPNDRVWMVLSTKAAAPSRRGTRDAFVSLSIKGGTGFVVDPVRTGITLGNTFGSADTFPFDVNSTVMSGEVTSGVGGGRPLCGWGIDFSNIDFGHEPFKTSLFAVSATGFVGAGMNAPVFPLDIFTSGAQVMRFNGTSTPWFIGSASATLAGYLRVIVGGSEVRIPCYQP